MTTLALPAEAALPQACALLAQLGDDTDAVDLGGAQSYDTSTIALLLEARRRAQARGAPFKVLNAPPKLVALAHLYGVESILELPAT